MSNPIRQASDASSNDSGFRVVADRRATDIERCVRRERHRAELFCYSIAEDGRAGTVQLSPGKRALKISADECDYHRIWIFTAATGDLVGTLECTTDGEVVWLAPGVCPASAPLR
jgi:hypothetical protein